MFFLAMSPACRVASNVAFAAGGALLERERELATMRDGVDRACAGQGALLLVEGPPGAGKTVLAREARRGRPGANDWCSRRLVELEQPFAFGVVRQLLEPVIARRPGGPICSPAPRDPRRVVRATGAAAAPMPTSMYSTALYWLMVNSPTGRRCSFRSTIASGPTGTHCGSWRT